MWRIFAGLKNEGRPKIKDAIYLFQVQLEQDTTSSFCTKRRGSFQEEHLYVFYYPTDFLLDPTSTLDLRFRSSRLTVHFSIRTARPARERPVRSVPLMLVGCQDWNGDRDSMSNQALAVLKTARPSLVIRCPAASCSQSFSDSPSLLYFK